MTKIKTSELQGAALDWAVARATLEETNCSADLIDHVAMKLVLDGYEPSTDWGQLGSHIEGFGIWLSDDATDEPQGPWIASVQGGYMQYGPTPLIAACRAIVAAKLGDEVDVPEELV